RPHVAGRSRGTEAAACAGGLRAESARRRLRARAVLPLQVTDEARRAAAAADVLPDRLARWAAPALVRRLHGADLAVRTRPTALAGRGIDSAGRWTADALGPFEMTRTPRSGRIAESGALPGGRILMTRTWLTDARVRAVVRQRALVGGIRAPSAARRRGADDRSTELCRRRAADAILVGVGQALERRIGAIAAARAGERVLAA